MNICTGITGWSYFFYFLEIISTIALATLYSRAIWRLVVHNEKDTYEKMDLLIIALSYLQLIMFIIIFCVDEFFIVSLIISILKFRENAIICCLFLVIIMWKHSSVTYVAVNYFMMIMLVFDILCLLFGIFEYKPFEMDYCKPKMILFLVIIGLIIDIGALCGGSYLYSVEKEEKQESLTEGDQMYINDMFNKYADDMKKMMKAYMVITLLFLTSSVIDIIFQVFLKRTMEISQSRILTTVDIETPYCDYYGKFEDKFGFKQCLICYITFLIRDLGAHIAIFFSFLIFKHNSLSRESSFIETL